LLLVVIISVIATIALVSYYRTYFYNVLHKLI